MEMSYIEIHAVELNDIIVIKDHWGQQLTRSVIQSNNNRLFVSIPNAHIIVSVKIISRAIDRFISERDVRLESGKTTHVCVDRCFNRLVSFKPGERPYINIRKNDDVYPELKELEFQVKNFLS